MPVEIKELVIRAVVNDAKSSTEINESEQSADGGSSSDNEIIIDACVRQVLQLLARDRER